MSAAVSRRGGEHRAELIDERDGKRAVVGRDADANGIPRHHENQATDLATAAPDRELHFVPGSERRAVPVRGGDGHQAVTEPRKYRVERWTLEARAARAKEIDQLTFDNVDEATGRTTSGSELRDATDLIHLAAARGRQPLASARPHDELTNHQADRQEDNRRFDVIAPADGERVVGASEEEVKAERRHDGRHGTAPSTADDGSGEHRKDQHQRGVRREHIAPERDEQSGECERAQQRRHPAADADPALAGVVVQRRAPLPFVERLPRS
jgi:hypothetical protein